MAKRSLKAYDPVELISIASPYGSDEISKIISAVGTLPGGELPIQTLEGDKIRSILRPRRDVLYNRLWIAGQNYRTSSLRDYAPTNRQLADRMKKIQIICTRLLDAVGACDGQSETIPYAISVLLQPQAAIEAEKRGQNPWGPPVGAVLREVISGVELLRRWTLDIQKNASAASKRKSSFDSPIDEFFLELCDIYQVVFDKKPGVSTGAVGRKNEGRRGGPFVRYIQACLKPIGLSRSAETIRLDLKRLERPARDRGKLRKK